MLFYEFHRSSAVKALAFGRGTSRFDPSGGTLLLPSPIVGPYSAEGGNVWWANVGHLWYSEQRPAGKLLPAAAAHHTAKNYGCRPPSGVKRTGKKP